ncbi:MAG TPA: ribose-5-phosphate isomerase RpiA [Gammaproteobacteria bacterium]|nr:ribose-5-phosphate isomerase RpiA [Gammaproteobacteria bacterium]
MEMSSDQRKRAAAEAAIEYIDDGMTLGVGTGSTIEHFIDVLSGHVQRVSAVASSSRRTTEALRAYDMEVRELSAIGDIDLYVDGADEATRHLQLIKGGGGALTREKILAGAARRFVCIVDDSKLVGRLGEFPLPVEVIPMARSFVARQAIRLGGQPIWREGFVTDNGNEILDVRNLDITDPAALETSFNQIPGVVTVGLFAHRSADVLLVAGSDGVEKITR